MATDKHPNTKYQPYLEINGQMGQFDPLLVSSTFNNELVMHELTGPVGHPGHVSTGRKFRVPSPVDARKLMELLLMKFPELQPESVKRLHNLLAVIHRDGGHTTEAVGEAEVCKRAEERVTKWLGRDTEQEESNRTFYEDLMKGRVESFVSKLLGKATSDINLAVDVGLAHEALQKLRDQAAEAKKEQKDSWLFIEDLSGTLHHQKADNESAVRDLVAAACDRDNDYLLFKNGKRITVKVTRTSGFGLDAEKRYSLLHTTCQNRSYTDVSGMGIAAYLKAHASKPGYVLIQLPELIQVPIKETTWTTLEFSEQQPAPLPF